jgi:hypothetical protein
MSYLQDFEAELEEKLKGVPEEVRKQLTRYIKEKIIESFKNGIQTAKLVRVYKSGKFNQKSKKAQ